MKKNELVEIKKMELAALQGRMEKTKEEIIKLAMEKNKGGNLKVVKNRRKELAQILTVLRQKQLLKELEVKNG